MPRLPAWVRLDAAAGYAATGALLRFATGPVTMVMVATSLTKSEQGFYFTFFSVVAAYQLIEAGMGFVATQGIASRMQGMALARRALAGDAAVAEAIHERIGFLLIWLAGVAVATAGPVWLAGRLLFQAETAVAWQIPWLLYVAASSVGIVVTGLGAALEGMQRPELAFRAQLAGSAASAAALWAGLAGGLGLHALPLATACAVLVQAALSAPPAARVHADALRLYVRHPGAGARRFAGVLRSSWPFFSRIAITWGFGFLYWNALPIVAFWRFGAVYAGELGFSIALLRVGLQFTESFLSSQRGRLGAALAAEPQRAWALFAARNRLAHAVLLSGYALFFAALPFLPDWLRMRMLPALDMALFAIGYAAMLLPLNAALLLRCTGREVFFRYSLALNLAVPALLLAAARLDAPIALATVFAVVHLAFLPWARGILVRHRGSGGAPS